MTDRINIFIDNGVADVRLVREDKMNALDDAMFARLISAAEEINADKSVRVVVLSGQGLAQPACAGDCRRSRRRFGRGLPGGAGRGYTDRAPGDETVDPGSEMGPCAGHELDRDHAAAGA